MLSGFGEAGHFGQRWSPGDVSFKCWPEPWLTATFKVWSSVHKNLMEIFQKSMAEVVGVLETGVVAGRAVVGGVESQGDSSSNGGGTKGILITYQRVIRA